MSRCAKKSLLGQNRPGVLFLGVNVMVLCFLTGSACHDVPLQSPLKQEELQGGRLLEFEICW